MNNSQIKSNPKGKAIISLILGIISIIGGIGAVYIYYILIDWELVLLFYFLIPLVGLFFGKMGLKSTQKKLAIIGMVLCIIGLLLVISFYLYAQMMAQTL